MEILYITYLIGICAEAVSATILAMRHKMDLFGILLLSVATALGGGNIRDVLLNHYPISWVEHPKYLLYISLSAVATIFLARYVHRVRRLFLAADAMGLVAFSVIGCNVGLELGVHWSVVLLSAMITGVFGGLLRDIIVNEVPLVLRRDLYATVAFITGLLYLGQLTLGIPQDFATVVSLVVGLSLRMVALQYGWGLPGFSTDGVQGLD